MCDAGHEHGPVHPRRGDPASGPPPRPGTDAPALLRGLQLLYHLEGRTEDVRRAIVASWADSDSPAEVVKQLSRLDAAPLPLEMTRRTLEKAAEDDDRVWLARANLAIRTGQFDRAAEWLDACSRRRPEDTAVWRARLELARATGDLAGGVARPRAPAGGRRSRRPSVLRLRVWLASRAGDATAERAALTALVEREPGDTAALDRLAALAGPDHDDRGSGPAPVEEVRDAGRPGALPGPAQGDSIGDPAELARLAETLGRRIEARGWALIRDRKVGQTRAVAPGPGSPTGKHPTSPRS